MTKELNTARRSTWREFLTWVKEPAAAIASIVTLLGVFATGVVAGSAWFVSSEVEPLRKELSRTSDATSIELQALRSQIRANEDKAEEDTKALTDSIKENGERASDNAERIAGAEATLEAANRAMDRLHGQVEKNTEAVTELKMRGTGE